MATGWEPGYSMANDAKTCSHSVIPRAAPPPYATQGASGTGHQSSRPSPEAQELGVREGPNDSGFGRHGREKSPESGGMENGDTPSHSVEEEPFEGGGLASSGLCHCCQNVANSAGEIRDE